MRHLSISNFAILFLLFGLFSCDKDTERIPDDSYHPDLQLADFPLSPELTNPYYLFDSGKTYVYEGMTEEGLEHIEVSRLPGLKTVMGIPCVVVRDLVWINGVLHEDTHDWYAQDKSGNVWYMGEEVDNFNPDGTLKDHAGAWEAGVDGAKPGIVMPASPMAGMKFRQEYYFNQAEDQAEILATNASVTTPFGSFSPCIHTHEFTELDADVNEQKWYAPGIGLVKEFNVEDGEEIQLIEIRE